MEIRWGVIIGVCWRVSCMTSLNWLFEARVTVRCRTGAWFWESVAAPIAVELAALREPAEG